MRYKLIDRIIMAVLIVVLMALSVGAIALALRAFPLEEVQRRIEYIYGYWPNAVIICAVSLVILLLGLRLLYAACTGGRRRQAPMLQVTQGEGGAVSVTVDTITGLIERTVSQIDGVQSSKCSIRSQESGIDILLKLTLADHVPIPEKTAQIQQQLKEEVQGLTGIMVSSVHIVVASKPPQKPSGQPL